METISEARTRTRTSNTLRIYVDSSWTVRNVLVFYQSIQNLYDIYSYAETLSSSKNSASKNFTDTELQVIGLLYQNILRREITIISNADVGSPYLVRVKSRQIHLIDCFGSVVAGCGVEA
jgi:hypothetical protein